MKGKNSFLEMMRFVFCMILFFHHSGFFASGNEAYPFKGAGSFAVEFFFILTGALSIKHVREKVNGEKDLSDGIMKYSFSYTLNKLKRVFPYACTGIILSYIWYFIQANYSRGIFRVLYRRWNIIYEMLFLPMSGTMSLDLNLYLNTPLWYLSVILLVLPFVMYIAIRYKDVFDNYLCYFLPLLIHGYLINKFGNIGNWSEYTLFSYSGVIRGFADIMLGGAVYLIGLAIYKKAEKCKGLLTLAEVGMYIFSIVIFALEVDGYTYEFAVLVMALAIGLSLSNSTYTSKCKGAIFDHLGKLSLPMYCLQWPIFRFVSEFGTGLNYNSGVMISMAVSICLSECLLLIIQRRKCSIKH